MQFVDLSVDQRQCRAQFLPFAEEQREINCALQAPSRLSERADNGGTPIVGLDAVNGHIRGRDDPIGFGASM